MNIPNLFTNDELIEDLLLEDKLVKLEGALIGTEINLQPQDKTGAKVLGIRWEAQEVYFSFVPEGIISVVRSLGGTATKRRSEVVRVSSTIYDPLGILAPTVLCIQVFIQQLWEKKLDWNEPIPFSSD